MADIVRVLRIIEYVGPRDRVEDVVSRSVHGERRYGSPKSKEVIIRAATIGEYPEILNAVEPIVAPAPQEKA